MLYGNDVKIDGLPCGLVMRGSANGEYLAVFERELCSLEEVEGIDWSAPSIQGSCVLPVGYGFAVKDIRYDHATRSYTVVLQVQEQYLGDVTGYQEQVSQLEDTVAQQTATIQSQEAAIQALEEAGTAAELTAELEAAYSEGVESNG